MPKTDVVNLFLVKLKITQHSIAMKREYEHFSKYLLMALIVTIFLYLIYDFFDNSISKQIYYCSKLGVRKERYRISKEKKEEAEPIMKCLRDNGLNPILRGSVSTNMAHKGSDIDLGIMHRGENLKEGAPIVHILNKCGFKKNENFVKNSVTYTKYGPYALYNGKTNNGTRVDLFISPFKHELWSNAVSYSNDDEEIRDCLYCINRYINDRNANKDLTQNIRNRTTRNLGRKPDPPWPSSKLQSNLNLFSRTRPHGA